MSIKNSTTQAMFRCVSGGRVTLLSALALVGACQADLPDLPRGSVPEEIVLLTEGPFTGGHAGWGWPSCATCHQAAHRGAFENDQCSVCHGANGAPVLKGSHPGWGLEGCSTCHPSPASHAPNLSTSGCVGCHGTNGTTVSPPSVSIPRLTESHTGWRWADCGACHSAEGTHGGQYPTTSCGGCHGGNGAPDRPRNHWLAGCNDCHVDGPYAWNPYTHIGFEHAEPRACVFCHR